MKRSGRLIPLVTLIQMKETLSAVELAEAKKEALNQRELGERISKLIDSYYDEFNHNLSNINSIVDVRSYSETITKLEILMQQQALSARLAQAQESQKYEEWRECRLDVKVINKAVDKIREEETRSAAKVQDKLTEEIVTIAFNRKNAQK